MGLADAVLRRGHLSEDALIDVWTTGLRPAHLDRCDRCAQRALEMSRWLEDVRTVGREDADAALSEASLSTQRDQILSRLTQLDRPSKVISFPSAPLATQQPFAPTRGRTAWLATAAAAAGIMIGIVGMELSHLVTFKTPAPTVASAPAPTLADDSGLLDSVFDRPSVGGLDALDGLTPSVVDVVLASNTNR